MIIPDGANELERKTQWVKIGKITDANFGFCELKEKANRTRFCVRILIFNDKKRGFNKQIWNKSSFLNSCLHYKTLLAHYNEFRIPVELNSNLLG